MEDLRKVVYDGFKKPIMILKPDKFFNDGTFEKSGRRYTVGGAYDLICSNPDNIRFTFDEKSEKDLRDAFKREIIRRDERDWERLEY